MPSFSFPQGISRRNLGVAVVALGVALVLGVYLLFTAPAQHALSATNASLQSQTALNTAAQSELANTHAGAGALIYGYAKQLDAMLPQLCTSTYTSSDCFNAQIFPLLAIPAIADQTGMKVDTLSEGTADVFEGATYYQYSISISGSYADLSSFVRQITTPDTVATAANGQKITLPLITLASVASSATPPGISATILVNVWYTNDPSQLPSSVTPAPSSPGSVTTTLPPTAAG